MEKVTLSIIGMVFLLTSVNTQTKEKQTLSDSTKIQIVETTQTNFGNYFTFNTSISFRDRYVFPVGPHAYKFPVVQPEFSLFFINSNPNRFFSSIGYLVWGSHGFKLRSLHEVDHLLIANFNLPREIKLSVIGMIWDYPDQTLAFAPGQKDWVTSIGISKDINFWKNHPTNLSLKLFNIYPVGDLPFGTGLMLELTQELPSVSIFSPRFYAQTFYSEDFYLFDRGFQEVRGGIKISAPLGNSTVTFDFIYQKAFKHIDLHYTGFFWGTKISF